MTKIYGLICPLCGEIRYIGKTVETLDRRLANHLSEARNHSANHRQRWIRKCLAAGYKPSIWLLEEIDSSVSWSERERAWIRKGREIGLPLTNQTSGGEGVPMDDPETILRWKENLVKAMREVAERPGYKESRSRASKKAWRMNRESILKAITSPECAKAQSEAKIRAWKDPEKRSRLMNRWNPESKKKQAEILELRREKMVKNPEARARQAETLRRTWAAKKANGGWRKTC